jgi:uncharacterized membrane protein
MKAQLHRIFDAVSGSYWFVPTLLALVGAALAVGLVALDRSQSAWHMTVEWLHLEEPAAARSVLETIAGSIMTVAGVAFSITIATVATTTAQFGPRLMSNFMRNRGNQITFGVFVMTFVYCLLVLRTVSGTNGSPADTVFVPNLAVGGALALAGLSLGALIYFFHHIPESIHITIIIASLGRDLGQQVRTLYPDRIGEAPPPAADDEARSLAFPGTLEDALEVTAHHTGYVQHIEGDDLLRTAGEHDVTVYVVGRPGTFVHAGLPIALIRPGSAADDRLTDRVRGCFAIGARRTARADVLFLAQQLVEVAIRALSPGIQDPFTAIYCLDWLRGAMIELGCRSGPSPFRLDEHGRLRLVSPPYTFADLAECVFGQLRPYAATDPNAARHFAESLALIAEAVPAAEPREIIARHAQAFATACVDAIPRPEDRAPIERRLAEAIGRAGGGDRIRSRITGPGTSHPLGR